MISKGGAKEVHRPTQSTSPSYFLCIYLSYKKAIVMRGVYFAGAIGYKLESNFTTLCAWAPHSAIFGPMRRVIFYIAIYIFCTCTLFLRVLRLVAWVGRKSGHFSSAALLTVAVSFGEKRPQLLNTYSFWLLAWANRCIWRKQKAKTDGKEQ